MKKFTEIKETKDLKYNDTLKNKIYGILEELNIKVSGEDTEELANVDINI